MDISRAAKEVTNFFLEYDIPESSREEILTNVYQILKKEVERAEIGYIDTDKYYPSDTNQ